MGTDMASLCILIDLLQLCGPADLPQPAHTPACIFALKGEVTRHALVNCYDFRRTRCRKLTERSIASNRKQSDPTILCHSYNSREPGV